METLAYLVVEIEGRYYWRIVGENAIYNRGPYGSDVAARRAAEYAINVQLSKYRKEEPIKLQTMKP